MLKIKNRNRLLTTIFCYAIIGFWIASYVLYFISANNETDIGHWFIRTFYMNALMYTQQTGLFSVIYAVIVLVNKRKNNVVGILCVSDFIITNFFAWIIFNNVNGWFTNPYYLIIDVINHMILFLLTLMIFVLTCLEPQKRTNYVKTSYRNVALYAWIHPTIFFVGAVIANFVKMPYNFDTVAYVNGYFTPYGLLTNYNPNGGGNLLMLTTIPAFFGIIYAVNLFFYRIDCLGFDKDNLNNLNHRRFNRVDTLIFINTFIFGITFTISITCEFIGLFIKGLISYGTYNLIESVSVGLSCCVLAINAYLYIYVRIHKIYHNVRIFLALSFGFSIIKIAGMICSVLLPYNPDFSEMINRMCFISVLYSLFILIFLIFSFVEIHRHKFKARTSA